MTLLCGVSKGFMKAFLHKTFWGTTKKCQNKKFTWFFSHRPGLLQREGLKFRIRFLDNLFHCIKILVLSQACHTTQTMKFSITDFFSKYDEIRRKMHLLKKLHLLKKHLMENFIFSAVLCKLQKMFKSETAYRAWHFTAILVKLFTHVNLYLSINFIKCCDKQVCGNPTYIQQLVTAK